jgi:hypothetical protein
MSAVHYQSSVQHTFRQAVVHLLENEYKLIGSHKVIQMIANDLADLQEEFFQDAPRVSPGQVVWRGTLDDGHKPPAGRRAEEEPTITAILPLITHEDIAEAAQGCPEGKNPVLWAHERDRRTIVRLFHAGLDNPAGPLLLSPAELSLLINRAIGTIRKCITDHFEQTGELLPTQGYVQDKGSKPTHKGIILRLYEKGKAPPDIAHFTNHSLEAVDRYIKDYERVKVLLNKGLDLADISHAIGRGIRTVQEYYKIILELYPDQILPKQEES